MGWSNQPDNHSKRRKKGSDSEKASSDLRSSISPDNKMRKDANTPRFQEHPFVGYVDSCDKQW